MNPPLIRRVCCALVPCLFRLPLSLAALALAIPAFATTVVPPKFAELVNKSDYIVRGVVKSVTSEWRASGPQRHIITKVELEVREVIRGTPPQLLTLQMLGGRVGTDEMVIQGAPRFKVGDEDILFIHGNGRQMNPLVALMHGRYPIKRDADTGREYMARSNGVPLRSEQEVARPMAGSVFASPVSTTTPLTAASPAPALSPAEFTSRIKAALNEDSRPKLEN